MRLLDTLRHTLLRRSSVPHSLVRHGFHDRRLPRLARPVSRSRLSLGAGLPTPPVRPTEGFPQSAEPGSSHGVTRKDTDFFPGHVWARFDTPTKRARRRAHAQPRAV